MATLEGVRELYFSPVGNISTLSKSGDIFTITATSGVKMVFHSNGTLNYIEDLNKNRITAEYSGELLTRLVHSSGQYLALNYSGGIIQSVTDHTGELAVQYAYQGEQLSGVVGITGKTTNYSYLTSGQGFRALSEVYQPDETRLSYEYDGNGRLMTGSFNDTPQFTLAYDIGTVIVINPIEGTTQSYFYDEAGNFVEYRDPLGRITKLKYNTDHALVGMVQPDGTSSSFKYDTKGNLIQHIDPLEQVTNFSYGAYNRLTGLTDANVHTTAYGYDPSGNNTSRTSPDLTAQSYTYDPSGELVAKTNRRGTPTQIIRGYNGRILRIDYNDNTFVAYSYNSVGAIIIVEDVTGITTMEYTDNHQLRRITYPGGRFLEYTYDLAGRRASMLDHTGYLLNYAYNSDGLLETISDGTGITHAHYIYDSQGRLVSRTVGNGVSTTWQYDLAGMVSAVDTFDDTGAVISYYHYEYDANDRRIKMTSLDGTWDYTYDATGQLVRALFTSISGEVESKDIEYVYDAVGNRVSEIINGSAIEYSVNSMNQYSRAGDFSYLYDTDGNLIQKTNGSETWTYEYNADNRLIRSTGPEEDKVYIYNGLGQLTTLIENGVERHYLVDPFGFGNIVGEYAKDGTRQSRYTHGLGLLGKDDYYYTFDGNGNTSELTDGASEIVNYYLYEPFGKSLYALEQSENDFEYVGQFGIMRMNDDLVYMRNRFYSPSLGRFMAEDPIGLLGGDVSFYRYVLNDPVNLVDPEGLKYCAPGELGHGRYTGDHPIAWISDKPDGSIDGAYSKDRLPGPLDDIDMVYINNEWYKIKAAYPMFLEKQDDGTYKFFADSNIFYPINQQPLFWSINDSMKDQHRDIPFGKVPCEYTKDKCQEFGLPSPDDQCN